MKYCTILLAAAAFAAGLPAAAQEPEGRDTIIVTGTRFDTPIDQVGRSVSVVSAEDIELRQQHFVFDALNIVPGVQVIRSGSFGSLASVSIRGLPSGQTLVVQDGVVLNDPSSFSNGFNFANFDTANIERIEVLRGAQSTLYGSDASGGVINIITKDGSEGFGGDAFVEGGSFGTVRGAASLLAGNERASGRVTVSGTTTRGFSTADEANGNTEDDGFHSLAISSKGRYAPIENFVIEAIARYQDSENEFDGFAFGIGPVDGDEVAETEEITAALFATHTGFEGALENRFSAAFRRIDQLNLTDGTPSFEALGTRISYEYQGTLKPTHWVSVIAGAEYDEQESKVTIGFGGNQKIETVSGFGLVQLQPISFLTINAGIRRDDATGFDSETTFSTSAAFELPQIQTIIRGSYAEGFRVPTAGELSFNPDLFAEFSEGWDIGVEQAVFHGRGRLSATYFNQEIVDLIAFDLAAFTFVNIQTFSTQGVEVAADVSVTDRLSLSASYTYTDAVNLSTTLAAGNQPKHRASVELFAQPVDHLSISMSVTYNGEEFAGTATLDAFILVHLRAAYEISKNLELFARIENATDADYQDNFGFGTAPLSAFGGVRASF